MTLTARPRLLLVETSGQVGQVALAEGGTLLEVRQLAEARRHARDLAPAVRALLAQHGWRPSDLQAIVVSRGPGSYTGLRVGIISARALAYATGCAILGIETFAVIAAQAPAEVGSLAVVADAQQDKLYVQHFARADSGAWRSAGDLRIVPLAEFSTSCPEATWLTGPGLHGYADRLPARKRLEPACWDPGIASLLRLGLDRFERGERDDHWRLEPLYARPSSAEEKWQTRALPPDAAC